MTDQDVMDIAGLLHAEEMKALQTLIDTRAEVPNSDPDWDVFHAARLIGAQQLFDHWHDVKGRFVDEHRETLNRGFGI